MTHNNSFHLYGLKWTADTIAFYLDGKPVRSTENTDWHDPLRIIFTTAIQLWAGKPSDAELGQSLPFLIDYVRVFRRQSDNDE